MDSDLDEFLAARRALEAARSAFKQHICAAEHLGPSNLAQTRAMVTLLNEVTHDYLVAADKLSVSRSGKY